jgi:hypothetical protein
LKSTLDGGNASCFIVCAVGGHEYNEKVVWCYVSRNNVLYHALT